MSRTRPKKDTKPRDSQTDDKSASLFPFLRACLSPSSPFFPILALSIFLKLLLIPSYSSTDFEVHRNWLAITRNLPIEKWYTENTSEWTLDYPPFFAWFEWTLGWVGMRVLELRTGLGIPGDQNLFKISEGPVMSWEILVFQRLTVVITDLVFWTAIVRLVTNTRILATERTLPRQILVAITYLNPGLLMVDHIHFQYNGFLFGILCWSIAMAFEGRELLSAALFAALLNFKHIYLYIAPAYFVWLLRGYCFKPSGSGRERFDLFRLVKLGLVVVSIFALSFGPFIASGVLRRDPSEQPMDAALGSLQAIVSRLFPFKRGLVHAYWAGNFWALYVSLDRFLAFGLKFLGFAVDMAAAQSATRGLVEDVTFAVLPDVRPGPAAGLTLLAQIPSLIVLWRKPNRSEFLNSLILCAYSSFIFGWHVHEKAVLLMTIPFSLIAANSKTHASLYMTLSVAGYYGLFPLLFGSMEWVIKWCLFGMWTIFAGRGLGCLLDSLKVPEQPPRSFAIKLFGEIFPRIYYPAAFVLMAVVLPIAHHVLDPTNRFEFLGNMMTSIYCAKGILISWIGLYLLVASE